jgi:fibronectin type 3 domain-containing protein
MGYYVYRGTSSGGERSTALNSTPINGTSYADANVTAGTTYYYVVTAVASDGVTQSADSNEAQATVP